MWRIKLINIKKIIFISVFILIISGLTGFSCSSDTTPETPSTTSDVKAVNGWGDCHQGEVNDRYPGSCHDYIDTNSDSICDHSQPSPQTNP